MGSNPTPSARILPIILILFNLFPAERQSGAQMTDPEIGTFGIVVLIVVGVLVALYAIRLTLRHYFSPDT